MTPEPARPSRHGREALQERESVREARVAQTRETSFMADSKVTTASLQALLDAFNAHDVDAVMSFFTEDCVFDMPRGPAPGGRRLIGRH